MRSKRPMGLRNAKSARGAARINGLRIPGDTGTPDEAKPAGGAGGAAQAFADLYRELGLC